MLLLLLLIVGAIHVSLCRQTESGEAVSDTDVEVERRLPAVSRPVLRGVATTGELQAILIARYGAAVAPLTSVESIAINSATKALANGTLPPGFGPGLAAARRRLAPLVGVARDAIQTGVVDPSFDADAWLKGTAPVVIRLDLASPAFALAELEALAAGKPRAAAELATDHLRLLDDLARWRSHDVGLSYRWGHWPRVPGLVTAQVLPALDDAELAATTAELGVLVATRPDPWSAARRSRVAYHRYLTRLRRRDLGPGYEDGQPPYWVPILGPTIRRDAHLWFASAAAVEEESRGAPAHALRDRAAALGPGFIAGQDVKEEVKRVLDTAFEDTARVRILRVLALSEKFRRERGRPPGSLEEALGHAPGPAEEDPFDGKPLRFTVQGDGVQVRSLGEDGIDGGGNARVGPRGRETDVVHELPPRPAPGAPGVR